ncbi:MAG: LysM peptidoglycan-binding domain-containing protein [Saprospiraceae bacterium]|nr:LysM peptidoglycan-binding domain-containing protein [Saprospiraceae bacterium]
MRYSLPLLLAIALAGPVGSAAQTGASNGAPSKTAATQAPPAAKTASPASLLTPQDSVFLTVENGNKIIHHHVKPKQTLFALAQFYGLSLQELYEIHPEFQTAPTLKVESVISIPVPNRVIRRYKGKNFSPAKFASIYYVVGVGDNLFGICKRHFNMPVDTIMKRNRMKSENIRPGQRIHMGWMSLDGVEASWRSSVAPTTGGTYQLRFDEDKKSHKEMVSQGVCFWQRDSNEKGDLYALHREAGIGTVMAVTNPMSRRTVFAKVIGRIPAGYESNIEVILSPAAARQIGARDPRFFVKLRFLR